MEAARVGKLLFGNPTRLKLALWIYETDKPRFYQSQPPREVGVTNAVRQALDQLVQVGMLDEERPDGENRVYYLKTDSPLWSVIGATASILSWRN